MPVTVLNGNTDIEKLKSLSALPYKAQAVWFLNGYWEEHGEHKERIFKLADRMIELDEKNGADGCELDEFLSHRFLETIDETQTVQEMRKTLRAVDIDTNNRVSLAEYLIFRFGVNWHDLIYKAQGDNSAEIERAQKLVNQAQEELAASRAAAEAATAAAREARESEQRARAAAHEAQKKTAEARTMEAAQKAAEDEVRASLNALEAEEKAYQDKLSSLEARANDASGGLVSRNKAKNELAQAKNEDPLPLQRAKITQAAAVRKSEKATAAAAAARSSAEAAEAAALSAKNEAEAALRDAEQARADADAAKAKSEASMAAALAFLEEAKNKDGVAHGAIWWMERELLESKKYLPQSKGGISKISG